MKKLNIKKIKHWIKTYKIYSRFEWSFLQFFHRSSSTWNIPNKQEMKEHIKFTKLEHKTFFSSVKWLFLTKNVTTKQVKKLNIKIIKYL